MTNPELSLTEKAQAWTSAARASLNETDESKEAKMYYDINLEIAEEWKEEHPELLDHLARMHDEWQASEELPSMSQIVGVCQFITRLRLVRTAQQ